MLSGKWTNNINIYRGTDKTDFNAQKSTFVSFGGEGLSIQAENLRIYERMKSALQTISAVYDQIPVSLHSEAFKKRAKEIDSMPQTTVAEIELWETKWREALASINCVKPTTFERNE